MLRGTRPGTAAWAAITASVAPSGLVFCTGTMGELASVVKIDDRQIGDGKVGPMTNRLSDFYAQRTAKEGVQMI